MEEVQIENIKEVSTETDINIIRSLATQFSMKHVGVKKTELVEQINAKLKEEMEMTENNVMVKEEVVGEIEVKVGGTTVPVEEITEVVSESEQLTVVTENEEVIGEIVETPENSTEIQEQPATEARQTGKWFEQEDTSYTFTEGQVIKVTAGYAPLIGRYASIIGPSKKRDAIKAHLFKPNKPSEMQDTKVTFNIGDFELYEGEVPAIETKRKKATVVFTVPEVETEVEAAATVEEVVEPVQATENEAV